MKDGRGEGEGRKPYLSFPPLPRSFTYAIFHAVFDSRSLFFAPKPHGTLATQAKIKCKTFMVKMSFICVRIKTIIFKSMAFHLASV